MFQRNNHGNISSKVSAIIIMVIGIGIMIVGILMAQTECGRMITTVSQQER